MMVRREEEDVKEVVRRYSYDNTDAGVDADTDTKEMFSILETSLPVTSASRSLTWRS
jgi:hypothetical protein